MVAQSFDTTDGGLQGVRGIVGPGHGTAEPGVRYRLDVVAADVADVVRFAGGWLFDRAMAGWDVTVLVADHSDERPLQILGAQIVDLEYALAYGGTPAASADPGGRGRPLRLRFPRPAGRRAGTRPGRHRGHLWGQTWPAELDDSVGLVQHRLSAAAQAFKAQALAAAAIPPDSIEPIETFRSRVMACPSVEADLDSGRLARPGSNFALLDVGFAAR